MSVSEECLAAMADLLCLCVDEAPGKFAAAVEAGDWQRADEIGEQAAEESAVLRLWELRSPGAASEPSHDGEEWQPGGEGEQQAPEHNRNPT